MVGIPILLLDSSKDAADSMEGATTGSQGRVHRLYTPLPTTGLVDDKDPMRVIKSSLSFNFSEFLVKSFFLFYSHINY